MADLDITECATYDEFVRIWHADTLAEHDVSLVEARDRGLLTEDDTRLRWQLLGQLDDDELLIELPEWLAEENTGYTDGATPTEFVGQIGRETDQAIQFVESAAARPLMNLAHRIHQLETGANDPDADEWMADRLADHREAFDRRDDAVSLQDEWLPKSQLLRVVRRRS